jgi:hypothetical protein
MAESHFPGCEILAPSAAPQANLKARHRELDGGRFTGLTRWRLELKQGGLGGRSDLQLCGLDDERQEATQAAHRSTKCGLAAHGELEQIEKTGGKVFGGEEPQIWSLRSFERDTQPALHVAPWKSRVGIGNRRPFVAELFETELIRASEFAVHGNEGPHDARRDQ